MSIVSLRRMALFAWATLASAGELSAQDAGSGTKLPAPTLGQELSYDRYVVQVGDHRISFVESGDGPPVVLIHGNPTSAYLWRNVMPHVAKGARAIALDLPGMGRSTKPPQGLRFAEQVEAFEGFIETLGLRDVTLVVHDWGAAIGFEYARLHPDNVRGIAFMEGVLPPVFPQPSFEAMGEEMGGMFRALKDPEQGRVMVVEQNLFVEQVLPGFVNRTLRAAEMEAYREPFTDPENREMVLQWPREIPIAGSPPDVVARMGEIFRFMTTTTTPMLLVYADPGVLVPPTLVGWYTENVRDIETAFVGQGLHFIQEDQPDAIGRAIRDWMRRRIAQPR